MDDDDVGLNDDDRFAPGERTDLKCPEPGCGADMVLRSSRYGYFYGCSRYPACKGTHGAHKDGSPMGTPADKATRQARIRAHDVLDRLWKQEGHRRGDLYGWLAREMHLDPEDAHIAMFNREQCEQVVQLVFESYPNMKTAWDMLDDNSRD